MSNRDLIESSTADAAINAVRRNAAGLMAASSRRCAMAETIYGIHKSDRRHRSGGRGRINRVDIGSSAPIDAKSVVQTPPANADDVAQADRKAIAVIEDFLVFFDPVAGTSPDASTKPESKSADSGPVNADKSGGTPSEAWPADPPDAEASTEERVSDSICHNYMWYDAADCHRDDGKAVVDAVDREKTMTVESLIDDFVDMTADHPDVRRRLMEAFRVKMALDSIGGHKDASNEIISDDDFRRMFLDAVGTSAQDS